MSSAITKTNLSAQLSMPKPVKANMAKDNLRNKVTAACFYMGSLLTEPFCKSHEYYRRIFTIKSLNPTSHKLIIVAKKLFLVMGIASFAVVGLVTTIPGLMLRKMGTWIEKDAYIHAKGNGTLKSLPANKEISLLSWNICGISAGYSISDGGVTPSAFRLKAIIQALDQTGADVNCLTEVFDIITAAYLAKELGKKGYQHFYYNIGAKALGVSSGLFVASRYALSNTQFTPFPQSSLSGRTKFARKGVFSFSLINNDNQSILARIHATHLSHSEKPGQPTKKEIAGRKQQLQIINQQANLIHQSIPSLITGDLNMDDNELSMNDSIKDFSSGDISSLVGQYTWNGDAWCAKNVVQKTVSNPQNLDHTIGKNTQLKSSIAFDTHYDANQYKASALSDHKPLLTIFSVS